MALRYKRLLEIKNRSRRRERGAVKRGCRREESEVLEVESNFDELRH